jgi:hypothetical protein
MEELIQQQNTLLQQLIGLLQIDRQTLGFTESPRPRYIYANRSNNCAWYWINDAREVVPIEKTALTCLIRKLEFETVERRGKDTIKLRLHVQADRPYIIEAGHDSHFSNGLMSALAVMHPEQLRQPITIEAQAADSEEVLFCRVYTSGELVFAPYDEQTDWRTVSKRAIANANANGNNQAEPVVSQPDKPAPVQPQTSDRPIVEAPRGGIVDRFTAQLNEMRTVEAAIALGVWLNKPENIQELNEVPGTLDVLRQRFNGYLEPMNLDIADISSQIQVEMKQLEYTPNYGKDLLKQRYKKRSRSELSIGELLDFLGYLQNQSQLQLTGVK